MIAKQTKIVCTIGPASESVATLTRMIRAGMDVARLNFSHGTYASHRQLMRNIRAAAKRVGKTVAILQDLQGPKIRVGDLPKEGVLLKKNQRIVLSTGASKFSTFPTSPSLRRGFGRQARLRRAGNFQLSIPVQYRRLHADVGKGDTILLDDGNFELRVETVRGRNIRCRVVVGGLLKSHKGINVPTASLSASPLTAKDRRDLAFGLANGVDFVALSFVRRAADVEQLRRLVQRGRKKVSGTFSSRGFLTPFSPPHVVVKIERREALDHLDAIIAAADAVMVARGDLALEADAASVPLYQKRIIQKSLEAAKAVITATEMLASMAEKPRPTRAEVSDVANAVIDHTDATMLSGESATGKYPVQTVETMAHVIRDTEQSPLDDLVEPPSVSPDARPVAAVSAAACTVAAEVGAAAIVAVTTTGFTARAISRHRPPRPIVAVTSTPITARQLVLSWGVLPLLHRGSDDARRRWVLTEIRRRKLAKRGDKIVLVAGLRADHAPKWEEAVRVVEA